MSQHTPGPWEYGIASNYDGFYIAPLGRLPTLAACERFGKSMTIDCFNFPGETEANARLIAAAPDLLEACIFVEAWWRLPKSDRTMERFERAMNEVIDAIAKAEDK